MFGTLVIATLTVFRLVIPALVLFGLGALINRSSTERARA
jgi:hypothetical protein